METCDRSERVFATAAITESPVLPLPPAISAAREARGFSLRRARRIPIVAAMFGEKQGVMLPAAPARLAQGGVAASDDASGRRDSPIPPAGRRCCWSAIMPGGGSGLARRSRLTAQELERHIAFDIGAADLTRRLAGLLDAPAVLCHVSRLVVDPNRVPGDPSSIPALSDGTLFRATASCRRPRSAGASPTPSSPTTARSRARSPSCAAATVRRRSSRSTASRRSSAAARGRGTSRSCRTPTGAWPARSRGPAPRPRTQGRRQPALFRPLPGRLHDPVPRRPERPAPRHL